MAVRMEVTSQTFKLEIDYGDEEIDENDAGTVKDVALAFMESRACEEDDVPDGVIIADKLHTAAITTDDPQRNDVGWKVGKKYAHWGDNLFKDKATKDQLIAILKPIVEGAVETGGNLFKQALKAILCDKLGVGMSLLFTDRSIIIQTNIQTCTHMHACNSSHTESIYCSIQ